VEDLGAPSASASGSTAARPAGCERSPHLLVACAIVGCLGSIALFVGNVVGSIVVPNYDWVADTVSDLAAGPYEIIQDVALYGYAAALGALAVAAAHDHLGGLRWSGGILCLMLLAAVVTIVGARNEYGDADAEGVVIHIYLVYLLGVLFLLAPLAMGHGLGRVHRVYAYISYGCASVWALGAPLFFMLPTGIDGLFERFLGIVTLTWVLMLCQVFCVRAFAPTPPRSS
jgi:hypothetical protein